MVERKIERVGERKESGDKSSLFIKTSTKRMRQTSGVRMAKDASTAFETPPQLTEP